MVNNISFLGKIYRYFAKHAWVIFVLWAFWLTVEYFGLGPFSYIRIHDLGDSNLPMRLSLIQGFFQHGFSYWFPYAACGIDRIATGPNLLQVDSLFFFTLPGWLAYGLVTFLQRFLAGYFTYRLCRDCLNLDRTPSIVTGLAYSISFSRLLYGAAHHAMLYGGFAGELGFPLILWALERIAKREGVTRYLFAFLLGLFAVFSSSFALSVPFILPMALAWFVLVRRQHSFKFLSLYAIFAATVVIGKTPTIWAMLANAPLSHRSTWKTLESMVGAWSNWMAQVTGFLRQLPGRAFVLSNIYWELGLLGLLWSRLKARPLLWIMLLLGFCGTIRGLWGPLRVILNPYMGFLAGYQFDRFYNLIPFFSAISAGYGLHLLLRNWSLVPEVPLNVKRWRVQGILSGIIICLLICHSFEIKDEHARGWFKSVRCYAVNYENTDLQYLSHNTDSPPFRIATVALSLHPAYANAYGLETVDGYVAMYSERYRDFWGKVIEPLTSQDENRYHYFHDWGSRIYLFAPSDGTFGAIQEIPFADYYNLNLLSLANTKYIISEKPIANRHLTLLPSQIPWPDTEKAWVNLSVIEKIRLGLKTNFRGRRLYIYKNEICLPRFFLVDQVRVFQDSRHLLEAMSQSDIDHLRNAVYIEDDFAANIKSTELGFVDGEVVLEEYSPDKIVLSVKLDGAGILVITNSYSPYWEAQVDGVYKAVLPVYHTFVGICVESGEKTVVLEYRPPYWAFY